MSAPQEWRFPGRFNLNGPSEGLDRVCSHCVNLQWAILELSESEQALRSRAANA
jgi:hypothetical protein